MYLLLFQKTHWKSWFGLPSEPGTCLVVAMEGMDCTISRLGLRGTLLMILNRKPPGPPCTSATIHGVIGRAPLLRNSVLRFTDLPSSTYTTAMLF